MSKKSDDLFHIYCDESRQTKHLYMMFGGIIVRYNDIPLLESAIQNWREDVKMYAELKWTKVSKGKLDDYKSLVDLFFSKASENKLAFKSAVFDTSGRNKRHHGGDREGEFYKLMSEFLLHHFGKYAISDKHRLLIFLDERSSSYSLYDLKALLNRGIRQRYGRNADVIRNVEPICSHKSDLLQIADILMGAIGYHYNDCHQRSEASAAKIELANYIAVKAGLSGLAQETPEEQEQFEIWQYSDKKRSALKT